MKDEELAVKADSAARRLLTYASALPSLGRAGTGAAIRRFLVKVVADFEVFDDALSVERRGPLHIQPSAKRPSQKG